MSPIDPITCLFCQHINPAGASFCNHCAAQLNLQPCLHCNAVDDRTAKRCYKCGAPLSLHQKTEPNAKAETSPLYTSQISPALGNSIVDPAKDVPLGGDLTFGLTANQQSYERSGSDVMTTVAVSRRGWWLYGATFLLVLLAVSAYQYSRQSGKNSHTAETKSPVQAESKAPIVAVKASQVDDAVTPVESPRKSAIDANVVGQAMTVTPLSSGFTSSTDSSSETSDAGPRRVSLPGNECVPAVATLGLCNPETGQEKP